MKMLVNIFSRFVNRPNKYIVCTSGVAGIVCFRLYGHMITNLPYVYNRHTDLNVLFQIPDKLPSIAI